jgi:glucose/mannose transport system permease protein
VQHLIRDLGWTDFVFDWITQPDRAIYTLVFAGIWHQSELIMAIMLAGLRGVDREIWRAARIEGISTWRTYISIILPMLRPLVVTCVVLIAIAVVKSYDLVVAMTNGGPGFASDLPGKSSSTSSSSAPISARRRLPRPSCWDRCSLSSRRICISS